MTRVNDLFLLHWLKNNLLNINWLNNNLLTNNWLNQKLLTNNWLFINCEISNDINDYQNQPFSDIGRANWDLPLPGLADHSLLWKNYYPYYPVWHIYLTRNHSNMYNYTCIDLGMTTTSCEKNIILSSPLLSNLLALTTASCAFS